MIKVEVDGKERTKVIKLSLLLIGLEKHEKCISDFFEGRSNVKIFFFDAFTCVPRFSKQGTQ